MAPNLLQVLIEEGTTVLAVVLVHAALEDRRLLAQQLHRLTDRLQVTLQLSVRLGLRCCLCIHSGRHFRTIGVEMWCQIAVTIYFSMLPYMVFLSLICIKS